MKNFLPRFSHFPEQVSWAARLAGIQVQVVGVVGILGTFGQRVSIAGLDQAPQLCNEEVGSSGQRVKTFQINEKNRFALLFD